MGVFLTKLAAILEHLTTAPGTTRAFLLRALNAREPESVLPAVLVTLDDTWNDPASLRALTMFVRARGEREADASFGGLLDAVSRDRVDALADRVATLRDVLPGRLVAAPQRWRVRSEAVDFLATVGTVWRDAPADEHVVADLMDWSLARMEAYHRVAQSAGRSPWSARQTSFEASGADLLARPGTWPPASCWRSCGPVATRRLLGRAQPSGAPSMSAGCSR